jgi:hypothetical protein
VTLLRDSFHEDMDIKALINNNYIINIMIRKRAGIIAILLLGIVGFALCHVEERYAS